MFVTTPMKPMLSMMFAARSSWVTVGIFFRSSLVTGNELTSVSVYLLIVSTAVAMGLRNAFVRKLAIPDLTTTVLTLTITGLAADSRLAGGAGSRSGRRLLSILTMCGGALTGAVLLRRFGISITLIATTLVVAGLALYLFQASARGAR